MSDLKRIVEMREVPMNKTSIALITVLVLAWTVVLSTPVYAETRLFVPHLSYGPQHETQFLLVNRNDHDSRVELWAFTSGGQLAGHTRVTVSRNSTQSMTLREAFHLSEPMSGWLGATSNDDGIGLSYSLLGEQDGRSVITSQDALKWMGKFFQETLEDPKRQVVRISNPNSFPAHVILNGLDHSGTAMARRDLIVPPFAQVETGVGEQLGNAVRLDMFSNADVVTSIGQGSSPPTPKVPSTTSSAMIESQQVALVVETPHTLGAYQVTLRFDPQVVQLLPEDVAGGFAQGFQSRPLVVNIDNAAGYVTLGSFQVGSDPSGRVAVARINISTKVRTASPFFVHVDEVADGAGNSISAAAVAASLVRLK
jgi:hypothetical protein